jgi:microcystin degradation protein MlrC
MIDAAAAAAAHRSGEGARIELALGGRNGPPGVTPFEATFEILRLAAGRFRTAGRTVGGRDIDLGPSALLRVGGVDIVVASRPMQPYDPMVFGHLGVDPFRYAVLALKSSVHFRADFAPRAEGILLVRAPGWHVLDLAAYPYRKLRPGVRLGPGGPVFLPAGHVR